MRVVEVERVEHERRARLERGAVRRPTARRTSPPAAPVIGTPRGSRGKRRGELVEALLQPLDHRRVGALLRPEDARRVLERRAHVAQHDDLRAAEPAGLLDRLERARAAVGRRRAADRDEDHRRAGARRRGDQLAGAVGRGRPRVALVLGDQRRARWPPPSRRSPCRRPRPARSRRRPARPSGSCTSAPTSSPPSWASSASSVPSPPSATGHRSGGISPARSSPRPIAPATWAARNVPLNVSGATSTGRSGSARPIGVRPLSGRRAGADESR